MPARTGTDGRGGRLRAVQATASASTSRATRDFISRPTRSRQRPRCAGRRRRSSGAGAVLIVPAAVPPGETPSLDERSPAPLGSCISALLSSWRHLGAELPHPECGSRIHRDNSLILVITGVEAGERAPSPRSGAESPCWPIVGGQRLPVVDTWTNRRLCTGVAVSPPRVPCLSPHRPQVVCRTSARRIDGYRSTSGPYRKLAGQGRG